MLPLVLRLTGVFLSTPSARRATREAAAFVMALDISIHVLREEGDCKVPSDDATTQEFLSTPSARRATWNWNADC